MRRALVVVLAAVVASACSEPGAPSASATTTELTIYGGASLRGALDAAKAAYEAAHQGVTLIVSTDSSAALAAKIEQGAPADIFLSADLDNPQKLVAKGLTVGEVVVFAANWLAIIVPIDNPGGVNSPKDLARPGLRIVAAGDEVPITKYATQLVAELAADPSYPRGFAEAYLANVVSKEDNVKAVVAKVELGEGDAALVYASDAMASARVTTVPILGHNVMSIYGAVVLKASNHAAAAEAFLSWLQGPGGRKILVDAGLFIPPA